MRYTCQMVISDLYRYLFIEIPLTGSWSVGNELCELYDGRRILHKHASYPEFARIATANQKTYFVFAAVRHPLDAVVSQFSKYQNNHKQAFTDSAAQAALFSEPADQAKFAFIQQQGVNFADYFTRFHRRPYNNTLSFSAPFCQFVMRFEQLDVDFEKALDRIGIDPKRSLPHLNKTINRTKHWQDPYKVAIRPQAQQLFYPFMQRWNYLFPSDWPDFRPKPYISLLWRTRSIAQRAYLLHVRHSNRRSAKWLRSVRGRFV